MKKKFRIYRTEIIRQIIVNAMMKLELNMLRNDGYLSLIGNGGHS